MCDDASETPPPRRSHAALRTALPLTALLSPLTPHPSPRTAHRAPRTAHPPFPRLLPLRPLSASDPARAASLCGFSPTGNGASRRQGRGEGCGGDKATSARRPEHRPPRQGSGGAESLYQRACRLVFEAREGTFCAASGPTREAPELKRLGEACFPTLTGRVCFRSAEALGGLG